MRTTLNNKRILIRLAIRQQNRTVRWQPTKCNAWERISKHVAFHQVSGTVAAGTMRELMITLQQIQYGIICQKLERCYTSLSCSYITTAMKISAWNVAAIQLHKKHDLTQI